MAVSITGSDAGLAILGGILIALSTSLNLFIKGRITGMSGIYYSLTTIEIKSFFWKASLVCGMIFITCIIYLSI